MKIALAYPKIPENSQKILGKCVAFEKYDGTNMHWCWNITDGWHKFGTRRTEFTFNESGIEEFIKEHSELKKAPTIFNEQLRDKLTLILNRYYYLYKEFTIFTEFHGPNSFAGAHSEEDALNGTQKLTIIDALFDSKMLGPEEFLAHINDAAGSLPIARVVYRGKFNGQFTEDVRKGKYNVNEGVVVKGIVDGEIFMTKVKTKDYLKRLTKR
jgi:hypothetical protein